LIYYYTVNKWELFDRDKDPDEMESLFERSGYKVHPNYESIVPDLVNQLKELRARYKDDTGLPAKMWPTSIVIHISAGPAGIGNPMLRQRWGERSRHLYTAWNGTS